MAKDLQPLTPQLEDAIQRCISIPNQAESVTEEQFEKGFHEVLQSQKGLINRPPIDRHRGLSHQ